MKAHLAALFAALALLSLAGCLYALVTGSDGILWLGALVLAACGFAGCERDAGLPQMAVDKRINDNLAKDIPCKD
jgi:hypothetical protein